MKFLYYPEACVKCGSSDLTWHCAPDNRGGVTDGRICMREVSVIFFLGCNACSETLRTVSGEEVAEWLTEEHKTR